MIRIFVGSQTGNIWLSMWIIIMIFLLAIFIASAKRRDDVLIYLESVLLDVISNRHFQKKVILHAFQMGHSG